jgi:hypothetical protein
LADTSNAAPAAICSTNPSQIYQGLRSEDYGMIGVLDGAVVTQMLSRPLRAINDRDESLAAFQLLKDVLSNDAQIFPDHLIGWQGGSRRHAAYWFPAVGIWAVLEPFPPSFKKGPGHRFWNCFGIGNRPSNTRSQLLLRSILRMQEKIGVSRGCSRETQIIAPISPIPAR